MIYTPEQIKRLLSNRTPGEWTITYRAPNYGFDVGTDAKFNLKGDRCMMFSSEGTAEFVAAAPEIVKQQAERIKELERAYEACFHALAEEMEGKIHAAIAVQSARETLDSFENPITPGMCTACKKEPANPDSKLCSACAIAIVRGMLGI